MDEPVNGTPVNQRTTTDAAADGDIDQRARAPRAPPAVLGERGAVHVGLEANRNAERAAQRSDEVDVLPAGLGCGRDRSVRRRARVEIDWAAARDAESG